MHLLSSALPLQAILAGCLILVACDDGSGADTSTSTTGDGPSHEADIQPIWDGVCVDACHEAGGEWPLLNLSAGKAHGALVGMVSSQVQAMNFVEPGDPDLSYLWHKINGTHVAAGGSGVQMPKARTGETFMPLAVEDVDLIEAWILSGAAP